MQAFLEKLASEPDSVEFEDTMAVIDQHFVFVPCAFDNGETSNSEGQNNGSCKIFAFAGLHKLTKQQTLHCFGRYYRGDVLGNPDGSDHQNIRQFIKHGWEGIVWHGSPLRSRS